MAVCAGIPALGAMAVALLLGAGIGWVAPLLGLATFVLGLGVGAGALAFTRFRDRRTAYALTETRLFLSRPGRGLRTARRADGWPLDELGPPRLRQHGDGSITLIFPRPADPLGPGLVALRRVPPGQGLRRLIARAAPAPGLRREAVAGNRRPWSPSSSAMPD